MYGKIILKAFIHGAAAALGSVIVTESARKLRNPCTRVELKKKFKVVK